MNKYEQAELDKVIKYINVNMCGVTSSLILINKIVNNTDEAMKTMNERVNWYTTDS
jgi:hypothetical protein